MVALVPHNLQSFGFVRLVRGRMGKFLVAGGISYLINQLVLFSIYEVAGQHTTSTPLGSLDVALLTAALVALEVSIIARFELNDRWTFAGHHGKPHCRRFIQSNFSSLGSPMISLAAVNLLTPILGLNYLITNSVGIVLGTAWNWYWSTRVVWRRSARVA